MIVFLISGLWHGAAWTYVIWGAIHGTVLVLSVLTQPSRDGAWRLLGTAVGGRWAGGESAPHTIPAPLEKLRNMLALLMTFHIVLISWVFFRADSVGTALQLIGNAFPLSGLEINVALGRDDLFISGLSILLLFGVEILQRRYRLSRLIAGQPTWVRWASYATAVLLVAFLGEFGATAFIYFQF
jgi:D-alanyl-lipoteichoic acid acyltransferase DltB (MBOAT superfamily)